MTVASTSGVPTSWKLSWPRLSTAPKFVYHLAGEPGVRPSWGPTFPRYARDNVLTTQALLESARGMRLRKLAYASSSSVYGHAADLPNTETLCPRPASPYGVTKLAA